MNPHHRHRDLIFPSPLGRGACADTHLHIRKNNPYSLTPFPKALGRRAPAPRVRLPRLEDRLSSSPMIACGKTTAFVPLLKKQCTSNKPFDADALPQQKRGSRRALVGERGLLGFGITVLGFRFAGISRTTVSWLGRKIW